jgi:hypothetical protein
MALLRKSNPSLPSGKTPTSLANGQILCDPDNKWKRDHVQAVA